jgi:hypothetical protein
MLLACSASVSVQAVSAAPDQLLRMKTRRRLSESGTAAAEISISVQKTSTLAILRQRDTC